VVRHAPTLDGQVRVDGNLRQLLGEALTLTGAAEVTGDLLLPGSPTLMREGAASIGATAIGSGNSQPSGYQLTLKGQAHLGRLVTRTDPIALPVVAAPPSPSGARDVVIKRAGQSIGDPTTLRNLTLTEQAGEVLLPPGTYGQVIAHGPSSLVLGVAGTTEPAVYNLQGLMLTDASRLRLLGPVTINLAAGLEWNDTSGSREHPEGLTVNVAGGAVTLNGASEFAGVLRAPASIVTLKGTARLRGMLMAGQLTLKGQALDQPVR
jgi:hypothetical protein